VRSSQHLIATRTMVRACRGQQRSAVISRVYLLIEQSCCGTRIVIFVETAGNRGGSLLDGSLDVLLQLQGVPPRHDLL